MLSLNFLITCLIVVRIPGTGVIYTISTGLTAGKRASVYAALGCTGGIIAGAELVAPQFCSSVCRAGVEFGARTALKVLRLTKAAETSHISVR